MGKVINLLWVGLGGALGSMLRYMMTCLVARYDLSNLLATFVVNVVGSFALGFLVGWLLQNSSYLPFATIGLCGGFTTFSTFSVQSVKLLREGKWEGAFLYVFGSVITCILFAWIGFYLSDLWKK